MTMDQLTGQKIARCQPSSATIGFRWEVRPRSATRRRSLQNTIGDRRGRCLRGQGRRKRGGDDHAHRPMHELGSQRRQPSVMTAHLPKGAATAVAPKPSRPRLSTKKAVVWATPDKPDPDNPNCSLDLDSSTYSMKELQKGIEGRGEIKRRSEGVLIDTVVCLTLAKWETVSGRFGGYLTAIQSRLIELAPERFG